MAGKINIKRWIDVVLLGLVGYALIYLVAGLAFVQTFFEKWIYLFSSMNIGVQTLLALTGFYSAHYLLKYFNVTHKNQLKNIDLFLYYPPITLSIILCLALHLLHFDSADFLGENFLRSYLLMAASTFLFLLRILYILDSPDSEKQEKKTPPDTPDWVEGGEQKYIYNWLMSEDPIDSLSEDKFQRKAYVNRLATLLETKEQANHIALVGPFGIGKTGLLNCVKERLTDDFIFVSVDGWARSAKTAAAQIIDEMVSVLSHYVDCASIRDVPREYMDALAGTNFDGLSFLSKILSLHNHQSPLDLIGKIDLMLKSIGKKMVVVLEDFDRNPNSENSINDIAGLLDRIRELNSISFIVCLAPGVKPHILSRVSLHREDILSFNASNIVNETINLMESCAKPKSGAFFGSEQAKTDEFVRAMSTVIKTPRDAKYALRRTLNAWKNGLYGEVNIYDLMAVNVLRYCAPEAFDFMVNNFDQMSEGITDVDSRGTEPLPSRVIELFSQEGINERNARKLIKILWPSWHSIQGEIFGFNVQRVAGRLGRVYLNRILTEEISPEHANETDLEFFGGIYAGDRPFDDVFTKKILDSDYWTEKFIELVGHSCQHNYFLAGIFPIFIDFMVMRCQSGRDMFFNELSNVRPGDIPFIIERIGKLTTKDTIAEIIEKMCGHPEQLFSSVSATLNFTVADQKKLWSDHKADLERLLSKSNSISADARVGAEALLQKL